MHLSTKCDDSIKCPVKGTLDRQLSNQQNKPSLLILFSVCVCVCVRVCVGACVRVCMCVCDPASKAINLLITNGMTWCDIDPI